MATKSGIITAINTQITAIITQAKLRLGFLQVVNEMYSDAVTDSNSTETYTTKAGTAITYNLTFKKSGNEVKMALSFRNTTGSSIASLEDIFTWKDSPYRPKNPQANFYINSYNGSNSCRLGILADTLSLVTPLVPSSQPFYTEFNFYIAQD